MNRRTFLKRAAATGAVAAVAPLSLLRTEPEAEPYDVAYEAVLPKPAQVLVSDQLLIDASGFSIEDHEFMEFPRGVRSPRLSPDDCLA